MKKIKKTLEATSNEGSEVKSSLTEREIEYIRFFCDENTDREIAELMHAGFHTVRDYRKSIMKKLGLNKAIGIVKYAIEHRIWKEK